MINVKIITLNQSNISASCTYGKIIMISAVKQLFINICTYFLTISTYLTTFELSLILHPIRSSEHTISIEFSILEFTLIPVCNTKT